MQCRCAPQLHAGTQDKCKGGGDGCSVRVNAREAGRWEGRGRKRECLAFSACKSWGTVSNAGCSHSQCKGKKSTVAAVSQDRILSQQRNHSCASCSKGSLCPHNTVLGLKENLVCAGGSIPSPSPQTTHRDPFRVPCGLCALLLYAPELPSACMGRAVFWAAWALLMRPVSCTGTGDEFPSLVCAQALQAGSPSLLACFLSTGRRVNWLLSSEN